MDGLRQDLAYAVRSLGAAPKFAAAVILTLALGLGANTAVFGVLHAVVLTPLPYPSADRLIRLYKFNRGEDNYLPGPAVLAFRDQSTTIDLAPVYTYATEGADLTDRAEPERVTSLRVGADYFRVLGVQPIVGQPFERIDERADAGVVVIRERLWREYFGGRPDAIGQSLSLNGVRQRVVAVLPDSFADPLVANVEVWSPIDLQTPARNRWGNHYLSAVGRIRPGATLEQAQADTARIAALIERNYGDTFPAIRARGASAGGHDRHRARPAVDGARRGRAAADDRVRERRRPGAGARRGARARAGRPRRARLLTVAAGAAARARERAAVARGRPRRSAQRARADAHAAGSRAGDRRAHGGRDRRAGSRCSRSASWPRSSPGSPSASCRPCSRRGRTSRACCGNQGAAPPAAAARRVSGRCWSSARSRSRWCCWPARVCCCAASSISRTSISAFVPTTC